MVPAGTTTVSSRCGSARRLIDGVFQRPRAELALRLDKRPFVDVHEMFGPGGLYLNSIRYIHSPRASGYDLPASTIGPDGAGKPPAGSSVTAKTSTFPRPASGGTRRLPAPLSSTPKTPAETG